ncbi:MAG: TonB-dependent receptor [Bacteroidetes bacterium HGW-Bacteroidetes-4]|jgi:iron complex outermembrane receptor protein|nr:MAG: TonB-dependent receptor [Bacteroidetes bacterium HGW-Bacteroidetes-4]
MITLLKTLFSLFFLLFISALFAQEPAVTVTDTIDIDEVVVTGSKVAVNKNQIPYTLSVIKPETISSSGESSLLPVLSEQVPGLFISERGVTGFGVADGSAGQISMRGLGGSPTTRVLILLNGSPQYMGIMGHPLADAYRSSNIERVEVIRGPASTLYGSNAMGGVINIITKEQTIDGHSANASLQFGSYNTFKIATGGGYKTGNFSNYAGINFDHTDGHRKASYFDIVDGYYKTSYKFNSNFKLSGDMSLAKFKGADPGLEQANVTIPGDTLNILRGMGSLVFNNNFVQSNGSVRLFYNYGKHDITSGFLSNDYNLGLVINQNFNWFKGNTLSLGVDYKNYGGKAELTKFMGGTELVDTAMTEIAGLLTLQQELFNKLTLNGGLRIDNHSTFGTEVIPTGGVSYRNNYQTLIKAAVSKGFRSPTIRELFIQFPFAPAPNANLKPESSINTEIGVQQNFLNNAIKLEITCFRIKAKNLINVGLDETNQPTFLNNGDALNRGIEFAFNQKINSQLSWTTNYTYIDIEKPVVGTPAHKFYLSVNYYPGKWKFHASYQHIADMYLAIGAQEIKENYSLLNARIAYQLLKELNVFVKAENLLNQEYTINMGYPMPGTTLMGGIYVRL